MLYLHFLPQVAKASLIQQDAQQKTDEDANAKQQQQLLPNPYQSTNFLFKLTWEWMTPLIFKGATKPLEMKDVWQLPDADRAHTVHENFNAKWEHYKAQPSNKYALFKSLHSSFGLYFWFAGLMKLTVDMFGIASPIIVRNIIAYVANPSAPIWHGILWYVFSL